MPINPAFHRHPAEATLIGRLVGAFGELEYMICIAAGKAINQKEPILRALYRLRSTNSRFQAADALLREECAKVGLTDDYTTMMRAVRYCLNVRNQFAHCNWADDPDATREGLFFANLQLSAEDITGWEHRWRHVDAPLLQSQEDYFTYTQDWVYFVDEELALRVGKLLNHPWPRPSEREQPPLHNPPDQHIPPWLTPNAQALHLARALAAKGGDPTPTPAHLEMEAAREAKRARRQADRDRSKCSDPDAEQ